MAEKLNLSELQRTNFITLIKHFTSTFPREALRKRFEAIDFAYHMELKQKVKQESETKRAKDTEDSDRFTQYDLPIVRKQIQSELPFLENIFLSDDPIFAVERSELGEAEDTIIKGINTKIKEDAQVAGWQFELSSFILSGVKYNLSAVEVTWDMKKIVQKRRTSEGTELTTANVEWQGNRIRAIDNYNMIFDTSVKPWDVAEKGEFAGEIERYSHTRLAELVGTLIQLQKESDVEMYLNYEEEMWGLTCHKAGATEFSYYQPDFLPTSEDSIGVDWSSTFNQAVGLDVESKKGQTGTYYDVLKMYVKFIPYAMGVKISENEEDNFLPQIWEFRVIGGEHILSAIPVTNSHGMLPTTICTPDLDNLGLLGKSSVGCTVDMQKLSAELVARRIAGIDRSIGDRAIIDSQYFDEDAFDKRIPDAKISTNSKFKNSRKSITDIYKDIPYRDSTGELLSRDIPFIMGMAEQTNLSNASRHGQFQKGNKTPDEVRQTLANSEAPLLRRALQLELQAFYRIKFMLQYNYIDYGDIQDFGDGTEQVRFDPQTLLSTSLRFRLAGGLDPLSIAMRQGELSQLFEMAMTIPIISQRYDLTKIFEDVFYASGLKLDKYRIPLEQLEQEAAAGATPSQQAGSSTPNQAPGT